MVRRLVVLVLLFTSMCAVGTGAGSCVGHHAAVAGPGVGADDGDGHTPERGEFAEERAEQGEGSARAAYKKKNPDADEASMKKLDEVFDSDAAVRL